MRKFLRILWIALVLLIVALLSALTTMRLAIHGREITVPDFQGKTPVEARRIADDNGLDVQIEREYYSPTVPRGRVLSQMPAAGTVVRRGWELRLALSLGPQRVAIPQVVGESERAATISMDERGLDPGSIAGVQISSVPAGQVVAQNPLPNATDVAAPKDQSADRPGRFPAGLRDAQLHRSTAGKRNHNSGQRRIPRPQSERGACHYSCRSGIAYRA